AEACEAARTERGAPVREALRKTVGKPAGERVAAVVEAMKAGGMFIAVQDIYPTATARHAHLVLPAAQWGEMNLTSINGERRLRLYPKFMDPPGEAIADWMIIARFARRLRALYLDVKNTLMAKRFLDYQCQWYEDVLVYDS